MKSDISTILVGAIHFVFTMVGAVLVDRLGRRILLLTSIIGVTTCTLALGTFFFLMDSGNDVSNLSWLPLTSLSIFIITFAIGYGPITWLMVSEVYSKQLSVFFSPVTGFFNWMLVFIITFTFRPLTETIGTGPTFWIFTGISVVGILFTFFVVPETKGKSMSEIQRMLSGEKNIDEQKT